MMGLGIAAFIVGTVVAVVALLAVLDDYGVNPDAHRTRVRARDAIRHAYFAMGFGAGLALWALGLILGTLT